MASAEYQLIETIVKRTLQDIQDSPERSIRNLVDMALHFATGKTEQSFFRIAQSMLQNEQSAYYGLIQDMAVHVDMDRLLRFGMNLGYNGCVLGAKTIRKIEAEEGFNIPWCISLMIDAQRCHDRMPQYNGLIAQANALGTYVFMIHARGGAQQILPLIAAHPDCAFICLCGADDVTEAFLESAQTLHHMMLAVRLSDDADEACALLREKKLLYSLYVPYGDQDAEQILSGELFDSAQTLHPVFTLLTPTASCSREKQKQIYRSAADAREQQIYRTIPLDVSQDFKLIDGIISDDDCTVCFDETGELWTAPGQAVRRAKNAFAAPLSDILRETFPKI